jgi:hypothetical protein
MSRHTTLVQKFSPFNLWELDQEAFKKELLSRNYMLVWLEHYSNMYIAKIYWVDDKSEFKANTECLNLMRKSGKWRSWKKRKK